MLGDVIRLTADETSALEAWEWLTDDPYIRVVEASKDSESEGWQVLVGVADLLRDSPLKTELRERVKAVLTAASGVTGVEEHNYGFLWYVAGRPAGRDLVIAAAQVVDDLADRIASSPGWNPDESP